MLDLKQFGKPKDLAKVAQWVETHKTMLDRPLLVLGFTKTETQYGFSAIAQVLPLDIEDPEESDIVAVLMGAQVLLNQLEAVADQLPMVATIVLKEGGKGEKGYYSFGETKQQYIDLFK